MGCMEVIICFIIICFMVLCFMGLVLCFMDFMGMERLDIFFMFFID